MENYHLSILMAFWKESMINRLSNQISLIVIAQQPKYDRFYALLITHHPPAAQTTPTNAFDFYTSGWPEYFSPLWCCNDKYHFLWLMFGQGRIAIKLLGRAQKPCFSFIISLNGIKILCFGCFSSSFNGHNLRHEHAMSCWSHLEARLSLYFYHPSVSTNAITWRCGWTVWYMIKINEYCTIFVELCFLKPLQQ